MLILTTIIFGFCSLRTLMFFTKDRTYSSLPYFISALLVCFLTICSYVWFLQQFYFVK